MEQQEQEKTVALQSELKTALVIEDDTVCERVLFSKLSQLGYQVEIANTAEKAVQFINTRSYTLITTNLGSQEHHIAVIGGVLESKINQETPLIICTANDDAVKNQVYLDFGVDQVLKKPIELEPLKESIETCLSLSRDKRKHNRKDLVKIINALNSNS